MRGNASRTTGRLARGVALLCTACVLGYLPFFVAYFAACGLPKLWDWQWHQCVTAQWDILSGIFREYWVLAPLRVMFWVSTFVVKLFFTIVFLWLFATTRAGRQLVFTMGSVLGAGYWLVRLSDRVGGITDPLWGTLLVCFITLIVGIAYTTLRTRIGEERKFLLASGIWGTLAVLIGLKQPVAVGLLSLVADPEAVLRDMHLRRDTAQVALSVLFFAFIYTTVHFPDQTMTLVLGLIVFISAILPVLYTWAGNNSPSDTSPTDV